MERPACSDESGDIAALHQALVDQLKRMGCISTPQVEAAFRAVPRHLFLPGVALDAVYRDAAIPTKFQDSQPISSSSQPAIMAIMLEQLDVRPGQRVMEIGAGTGYNAALIAHIVGAAGHVVTVDLDEDIVENARAHLAASGLQRVQVVHGDGGLGHPDAAPYDRIILTVGAWDIAPAWREQLKPGGRLVAPLSLGGPQKSVAFDHAGDHLASASVRDCGFMRLRGAFAGPETRIPLGPEPGLYLELENPRMIEADAIYTALTGPSKDWPTTVQGTFREIWGGLSVWLGLRAPDLCSLIAEGDAIVERGIVPYFLEYHNGRWRSRYTSGLLREASLCVLVRPPDQFPDQEQHSEPQPFELLVRGFGPDETLVQRLIAQIKAWEAAGRPDSQRLGIRAYPHTIAYTPAPKQIVLQKRWNRLVIDWQ